MTVVAFTEAVAVGLLAMLGCGVLVGGLLLLITTAHGDTRSRQRQEMEARR